MTSEEKFDSYWVMPVRTAIAEQTAVSDGGCLR